MSQKPTFAAALERIIYEKDLLPARSRKHAKLQKAVNILVEYWKST